MKYNKSDLNVSIVFYETYKNSDDISEKLTIFLNLLEFLNNDNYVKSILVVDNSPVDKIKKNLQNFKKVKYVFVNRNIGFSKGHNLSKKYLKKSKFHLILNPDIVLEDKNLFKNIIDFLDTNNDVAMIQPLICDYIGENIQYLCKKNPSLLIQIIRGFFRKKIKKFSFLYKYNFNYEMRNIAYSNSIVESQYLSGAFMLCRREILDKVDWFDERYFMYLEDADLTRKLSKHGKCVHNPSFKIRHVWAKGSHNNNHLKMIAIISFVKYSFKWGLKLY
ncbi:MAG: glycosyltransferase family 2 protein [Prochlorococcus marinus XMU1429]|nr:glycosyltransferase family 2 protein [Prochlorococcus marinus XMU1429]